MRIELSQTAKNSLEEIILFLKTRWTQKELDYFQNDIKKFRKTIEEKIIVHQSLESFPDIKYMLIGKKQVKIFYEIKENFVLVKLFWHCKQNPKRLKDLLL